MSHHRRSYIKVPHGKWSYYGAEGIIVFLAALFYWAAFWLWVAGRSLYLYLRKR